MSPGADSPSLLAEFTLLQEAQNSSENSRRMLSWPGTLSLDLGVNSRNLDLWKEVKRARISDPNSEPRSESQQKESPSVQQSTNRSKTNRVAALKWSRCISDSQVSDPISFKR